MREKVRPFVGAHPKAKPLTDSARWLDAAASLARLAAERGATISFF
jgi:hypothetical protein